MAGGYSSATLDQVRAANDIVEVIGASVRLKRAGANFVGLCPFHREKTPSFNVNPQRQIFHCFGCHKGGDVFAFVREFEHVTFVEAVQRLAQRAGMRVAMEGGGGPDDAARRQRERLLELHEQLTKRWLAVLQKEPAGQPGRDYLAKRGLGAEAVQRFRLGFAPPAWDDTVHWGREKNFEPGLLETAGLVVRREGGGYYDRFRGRLMFPIADEQGRVIGFSGRILESDAAVAKYVNSPETPIFTKGRVIYGLDKAKRALLDQGVAIVCEGQLDLIACHLAGIENVVAPQGTALTAHHTRVLRRYVEEVILCFDSDPAGQKATIRALDDLLSSGLAIRVVEMPAPHDPDSFLRERGPVEFRALVEKSVGFFDFHLAWLVREHGVTTDRGRMAIVREMGAGLRKTGSPLLLDTYARQAAQRLGVSVDAVRAEFRRGTDSSDRRREEVSVEEALTPPAEPPPPAEMWLLRLLLRSEESATWVGAQVQPDWVTHVGTRRILSLWLEQHQRGTWRSLADFLGLLDESERRWVTEAAAGQREIPEPQRQLQELLRRLRDQALDREVARWAQRMADPSLSEAERLDCLRRQMELREAKRQPLPSPTSDAAETNPSR